VGDGYAPAALYPVDQVLPDHAVIRSWIGDEVTKLGVAGRSRGGSKHTRGPQTL